MNNFKLREALKKRKKLTGNSMTQLELAKKLFPELNEKTALYHTNMALNGNAFGRFTPEKIVKCCKILKCEPNFLLDYQPINTNTKTNGTTTKK